MTLFNGITKWAVGQLLPGTAVEGVQNSLTTKYFMTNGDKSEQGKVCLMSQT